MQHQYWSEERAGKEGIDWAKLQSKEIVPPWIPEPMRDYIDNEFLRQKPPSLEDGSRASRQPSDGSERRVALHSLTYFRRLAIAPGPSK